MQQLVMELRFVRLKRRVIKTEPKVEMRQEQLGFDLIQPIDDVATSDKILFSIELRRCTNPEHARTLPLCLFSYTQINGRVYFRSWCKFCEAARERRRHKEVVKMRQAIEDREAAKMQRMMTKYFRVGR